jgi:branched-chain amino acid transport system permease protein
MESQAAYLDRAGGPDRRLCGWSSGSSAPWGRMMRAIRDNEDAARAMGKDVEFRRLEAFIFGAALMGLGGALFAHFNRSITPEAIDPMVATFLVWIMLILGGSGNNRGAILGAAVVWIIWSVSEIATDRFRMNMRSRRNTSACS